MSTFSFQMPDTRAFLFTLQQYLESSGQQEASDLLVGSSLDFSPTGEFGRRWNSQLTRVVLTVDVSELRRFTDSVRSTLSQSIDELFPAETGYEISELSVIPRLVSPLSDEQFVSNNATLGTANVITHDGLGFRSKTEIRVYDELKKRGVLFFANATAVLGRQDQKREPDFLVCLDGKWGILEVMGEPYHPSSTAMRDHDRARLFKDHGLFVIEFYDARRCYNDTNSVVDEFLNLLARS